MPSAALSSVGVPQMGIAADLAMGMFFAPATHVGVLDKAPRKQLSDSVRDSIRRGQGGRCAKCGKRFYEGNMEVDHRWPIAKGGQNWMINLQALCRTCNRSKGAKLEPVIGDVLSTAFAALPLAAIGGLPGQALSFMEFGALVEAGTALTGQAGALIPFIAVTPTTAILIVGGVVLVVVGAFAVKWLLGHAADGERRYVRLSRIASNALSGLARHFGGVARHVEPARHLPQQVGRATIGAGTYAKGVSVSTAQQMTNAASHVTWHFQGMADRASQLTANTPGHVSSHARNAARGAETARALAQRHIGQVAERMPKVRKRAPEVAAARDGEIGAGRWF